MSPKNGWRLQDFLYRVSFPRRTVYLVATLGFILVIGVMFGVVWLFYQYETNRLREPPKLEHTIPVLLRDDLEYFVKRVRPAPPPPPPPAAPPSPEGLELTPSP